MITFAEIASRAAVRKGGVEALEDRLIKPLSAAQVAEIPEDRWLSDMTRCIFQAGFSWELIDKRWPQFEEAFEGFSVTRWLFMGDDDLADLLKAPGVIPNARKVQSVAANAKFLSEIAESHGSAGAWFASWPVGGYIELCDELKTRGSHLGGMTGQRAMRRAGRDALILTSSVVKGLVAAGVVAGEPKSKSDLKAVQGAIAAWHAESGRGLTQMSQILAFSVD
ncbi:MAG: DNA-3-methyladenine glycosylase I [Asticcacaulis sp.]|nr:DNA-3-methyladenine glycosylase I [Asticcacaulis sp.]